MIRAFTDADLEPAAELLAERHERHRAAEPLLPAEVDFRGQVEKEWRADGASGVASEDGYLFGSPGAYDTFYVGIGGHALRGDAERLRDLYAAAAGAWLDAGHRSQMVFVPSHDAALVDAWFRLSFGASAMLAMRETAGAHPVETEVTIRRGAPGDLDASWRLDRELTDAMAPSPSTTDVSSRTSSSTAGRTTCACRRTRSTSRTRRRSPKHEDLAPHAR